MSIKRMLILLQKCYRILSRHKGGSSVIYKKLRKIVIGGMLSAAIVTVATPVNDLCKVVAAENEIPEELQITKITFDKTYPQRAGTRVLLSADCKGGTGEYAYTYTVKLPDGSYQVIAEDTECDYISYTLDQVGIYNFEVKVKDAFDIVTDVKEFIATPSKVSINSVKLNKSSYKVNDNVKFTVKATPSIGTVQSKIVIQTPKGKMVKVKDYSTKNTASYKVKKKGIYKVTIYVKDGESSTKVSKSFKVK